MDFQDFTWFPAHSKKKHTYHEKNAVPAVSEIVDPIAKIAIFFEKKKKIKKNHPSERRNVFNR